MPTEPLDDDEADEISSAGAPPRTMLFWAIASCLCGGGFFGLVALYHAAQAIVYWNAGDHASADDSAAQSRSWLIAGYVLGAILGGFYLLAQFNNPFRPW